MAKYNFVFKREECKSYKDFYEKVYSVLGKDIPDSIVDYENLHYNADLLNEYLWYFHCDHLHFKFIGFDVEKIKTSRPYENYEWSLIFRIVERLAKEYPSVTVEYIAEE